MLDLYGIDLPSHLETLPSFETCSKLVKLPNLNDFDIDENVINVVNSKYYSITECNKLHLNQKKNSVYHTNIRSLSENMDALNTQLSMINIPFHIIGIYKTNHQINKDFLVNVDMQGYSM